MCQRCSMQIMGLLLARSRVEVEDMIGVVVRVAGRCGLNINKGKSNDLLYNHRGIPPERVGGTYSSSK